MTPKKMFDFYYNTEYVFYVHVDQKRCVLPDYLQESKSAWITLEIGADLPIPVENLSLDEEGFGCILSFQGMPEGVYIPWNAVYAMGSADGQGIVFKSIPGFHTPVKPGTEPEVTPQAPADENAGNVVNLLDYKRRKGLV